jgi:hypothetical protein
MRLGNAGPNKKLALKSEFFNSDGRRMALLKDHGSAGGKLSSCFGRLGGDPGKVISSIKVVPPETTSNSSNDNTCMQLSSSFVRLSSKITMNVSSWKINFTGLDRVKYSPIFTL